MRDRELSSLHVLHAVPSLDLAGGGPARSVIRLAEAQQKLGASVRVVTGGEFAAGESSQQTPGGVEVLRSRHLSLPFEIPSAAMQRMLGREIEQADVVHLHSLWNGTITSAARAARKAKVPYVVSPRGMLDPEAVRQRGALKRVYRALIDRATAKGAAGFHFLTDDELRTAAWPPYPGQRTAIIPNGVDVDAVQRAAAASSTDVFADPGVNLLYLGRLHPTKGLRLQIDALALLASGGLDARLYFIGPDDGEGKRLIQYATETKLEQRVKVLPPVYSDDRFGLLKRAQCVLLTSHFEGNSVSAMETMAAGGLLVATRTTHLGDAARRDAAMVVDRTAGAVAEAVTRVIETPGLAESIRARAVEYARAELEATVIARRMLSFYDEILGIAFAAGARA